MIAEDPELGKSRRNFDIAEEIDALPGVNAESFRQFATALNVVVSKPERIVVPLGYHTFSTHAEPVEPLDQVGLAVLIPTSEQNFDILFGDTTFDVDALADELASDVDVALAILAVTGPL